MKRIHISYIITLFFCIIYNNTYAQKNKVEMHSIQIPVEFKSNEKLSTNKGNSSKTETKYFDKIKGSIVIIFDKSGKAIDIKTPSSISEYLLTAKPSEQSKTQYPIGFEICRGECNGGIWCTVECAIDHLL